MCIYSGGGSLEVLPDIVHVLISWIMLADNLAGSVLTEIMLAIMLISSIQFFSDVHLGCA